jgi:hypothetical protein
MMVPLCVIIRSTVPSYLNCMQYQSANPGALPWAFRLMQK